MVGKAFLKVPSFSKCVQIAFPRLTSLHLGIIGQREGRNAQIQAAGSRDVRLCVGRVDLRSRAKTAERDRRLAADDRTEAEMAQRSAGRSLGTSCQTLGRVLIKMGLVSNGDRCPLYPRKQTCAVHSAISAMCQERTRAVQQTALTNTSSANTSSVAGAHTEAGCNIYFRISSASSTYTLDTHCECHTGQLLRRLSARPSPAPSCATGP